MTRSAHRETGVASIATAIFAADVIAATSEISPLDTTAGKIGAIAVGVISAVAAVRSSIEAIADYQFAAARDAAMSGITFEVHPDTLRQNPDTST